MYKKFNKKSFWDMVEQNRKEVATWSKWKQRIIITAETASTGQFIKKREIK